MTLYYSVFIVSMLLSSFNTVYLYKKFQLTAGTRFQATVMYLIINGVVSAALPAAIMIIRGDPMRFSLYSVSVALAIVVCSAINLMAQMKAYEKGKIATVNIIGTVGSIILSCAFGLIVLRETLSVPAAVAIGIMLISTLLIQSDRKESGGKGLTWLYVAVVVAGGAIAILNKQHQVETRFTAVDTLSFSVLIGVIRTVLFSVPAIRYAIRKGAGSLGCSGSAAAYATASSVLSGACYIATLFTSTVLPIVITSPLGTGLSIIMCTLLPWVIYRERLNKKQIVGVILSLAGAVMFLIG